MPPIGKFLIFFPSPNKIPFLQDYSCKFSSHSVKWFLIYSVLKLQFNYNHPVRLTLSERRNFVSFSTEKLHNTASSHLLVWEWFQLLCGGCCPICTCCTSNPTTRTIAFSKWPLLAFDPHVFITLPMPEKWRRESMCIFRIYCPKTDGQPGGPPSR